mmetsp:Transcript_52023/g.138673  ORF Transcript_52023/g.138673 Transcript_52023/m.138673 type:complete len:137 (-) Transcript_52023:1339-1749(-)
MCSVTVPVRSSRLAMRGCSSSVTVPVTSVEPRQSTVMSAQVAMESPNSRAVRSRDCHRRARSARFEQSLASPVSCAADPHCTELCACRSFLRKLIGQAERATAWLFFQSRLTWVIASGTPFLYLILDPCVEKFGFS